MTLASDDCYDDDEPYDQSDHCDYDDDVDHDDYRSFFFMRLLKLRVNLPYWPSNPWRY